jgi:hypothetical protein
LFDALAQVWSNLALLGSATRRKARLLIGWTLAIGHGAYIGAIVVAALLIVGGKGLLFQGGQYSAPALAPTAQETSLPSPNVAATVAKATDVRLGSSTPVATSNPASTTASVAVDTSRVASIPAPALLPPGKSRGEKQPTGRAPDQIGDLLSGKPVRDESRLIREVQTALVKLGYPVKTDGAEDGDTRRAIRDFQRAHGLTRTNEISGQLVEQLNAAAKVGR